MMMFAWKKETCKKRCTLTYDKAHFISVYLFGYYISVNRVELHLSGRW